MRDILHDTWSEFADELKANTSFGINLMSSNSFQRAEMLDLKGKFDILCNSYNVQAIAFRCAYTTKRELIDQVLKLRANINCNLNVQQALAVHVQPFINQIVSISVAVAVLIPLNAIASTSAAK